MLERTVSELRYRFRRLFNRAAVERELDAELRFHIEREVEKLAASGVPRAEAERRARASFGGIERIKDDTRDSHGTATIEGIVQDIRYALRGLRARPTFTLGILLTLGLGIGANAAMFGVVDRVLVRPPAMMRDPSFVHRLYRETKDEDGRRIDRQLAFPTYLDLKREATAFSDVAAFSTMIFAVGEGSETREMRVTAASANYFNFFDARPALGRFFIAAEDSIPAGTHVAVLGYDHWRSRFGGRDVLGEQLRIGRSLFTIVGVAPQHFTGMSDQAMPAAYIPISVYAASGNRGLAYPTQYTWSWVELVARRKSQVPEETAEASATKAFADSWRNAEARHPGGYGAPETLNLRGIIGPVQIERGPQAGRDSRVALWVGGVALIVLLIACANVANLMLARAVSRRREIAMRLALGVTRRRLIRQLLTESGMLAVTGGIAGLLVAKWGGAAIRRLFLPPEFGDSVVTDGRTLAFTAVATFAAALLTGLVPAWNAGRGDVVSALKAGGRDGGGRRSGLRAGLLVFQAALSVLLLVGAGLFVRSLNNARGVRLGYDPDSVLIASVNLRGAALDSAQRATLMPRLLETALALPGVTSATLAGSAPFMGNEQRPITVPGVDSAFRKGRFLLQFVAPRYFETMGTRIVRGRALDATDRVTSEKVAVVSEGMAKVLWPGRDAIGLCFGVAGESCIRVVGISEDIRLRSFVDAREFTYYIPAEQYPRIADAGRLFVRVKGLAAGQVAAVRARLQELLPAPAYPTVLPMSRVVDPNFRAWRFAATMFVAFGGLALLLAAIGLYSLMAYEVAQRTRDMSVRIALGASGPRVVRLVVGNGLRLVVLGVGVGGAAAWYAAPRAQGLMFRQDALDPMIFAGVGAALIVVGTLAALVPALRASRVDPALMLRAD